MHPIDTVASPFSNSAGAVAFWLFIAVCGVASVLAPWLRQREMHKTLRVFAEKGVAPDSAALEAVLKSGRDASLRRPRDLLFSSLIVLGAGLGIPVVGLCISLMEHRQIYVIYGGGFLVFMVGLVMTGYSLWAMKNPVGGDRGPGA